MEADKKPRANLLKENIPLSASTREGRITVIEG
jgi:hypothetical protein